MEYTIAQVSSMLGISTNWNGDVLSAGLFSAAALLNSLARPLGGSGWWAAQLFNACLSSKSNRSISGKLVVQFWKGFAARFELFFQRQPAVMQARFNRSFRDDQDFGDLLQG